MGRVMRGAWLDGMYDNRARIPDHPAHFARWRARSEAARRGAWCTLDIAYGPSPGQTLDVFPAPGGSAPTMVFIHGGYWRSLDKSDHSFIAPAFQQAGACVVVPNYDLCPVVTIPQIVAQLSRALAWTWTHAAGYGGDPARITVVGHSAGGHLAAMMLTLDWPAVDPACPAGLVSKALAVSGLFDLEPLLHVSFLGELQLTESDALQASPARLPAPNDVALFAVCGSEESEEYRRQNRLIQEAWGPSTVPVCDELEHLNHLAIVDAMAEPGHPLHQLALELLHR